MRNLRVYCCPYLYSALPSLPTFQFNWTLRLYLSKNLESMHRWLCSDLMKRIVLCCRATFIVVEELFVEELYSIRDSIAVICCNEKPKGFLLDISIYFTPLATTYSLQLNLRLYICPRTLKQNLFIFLDKCKYLKTITMLCFHLLFFCKQKYNKLYYEHISNKLIYFN